MGNFAWVRSLNGHEVAAARVKQTAGTLPSVTLVPSKSVVTVAGPLTITAVPVAPAGIASIAFYSGTPGGTHALLQTVTAAPWRTTVNLTSSSNGTRSYYAVITDGLGRAVTSDPVSVAVSIGTSASIAIDDATLPAGTAGSAYSQQIAFTAPSGATVTGSNVPPGFSLSSAGLLSSATSPLAGTWQIDVTVSKAGYTPASARITVTIHPAVAAGRSASAWATKLQG